MHGVAMCGTGSGQGSNFGALLERQACGDLKVEFVLFIGNNRETGAFARRASMRYRRSFSRLPFPRRGLYHAAARRAERPWVELVILAGYMKKLPLAVVRAFRHRIVNIHPALLPAFGGKGMYGSHVHEAVIAYGAKLSGITVHFVDEEYDNGPIILQRAVEVLDSDDAHSLAARVLAVEHASYWQAIAAIAEGSIKH